MLTLFDDAKGSIGPHCATPVPAKLVPDMSKWVKRGRASISAANTYKIILYNLMHTM